MKFADLFTDEKTHRLSTTKLWVNVANVVMSYVILRQDQVGWELLAAYGAIVGGSYVGGKFLRMRYGNDTKLDK